MDRLPKHASSDAWMRPLDDGAKLLPPRGKPTDDGTQRGMPINIVDSRVIGFRSVILNLNYSAKSYTGGYPLPANPVVQGDPGWHPDRHVLLLDQADCTAYELIGYEPAAKVLFGVHTALTGTRYSLSSLTMPVITTNAPNTPMVGQYATVAEANAGKINHPIGWCSNLIGTEHVWPARQSDGMQSSTSIPMGAWIRLKRNVDVSQFTGQARSIVAGLRHHGAVLTDTCGHRLAIMSEASTGWNDDEMQQLRTLDAGAFEVVDVRSMIKDPTTYEIR